MVHCFCYILNILNVFLIYKLYILHYIDDILHYIDDTYIINDGDDETIYSQLNASLMKLTKKMNL